MNIDISIIFYFLQNIIRFILSIEPDKLHIVFDIGRDLKKRQKYEKYKTNRLDVKDRNILGYMMEKEQYTKLEQSRKIIIEILNTLPLHLYVLPFVEGDTIIGNIALEEQKENNDVIIFTGDKDILQMIDTNISVFLFKRTLEDSILYNIDNKKYIWNEVNLKSDKEIVLSPSCMPYFRSIIGDHSDAILGVKKLGKGFVNILFNIFNDLGIKEINSFDECVDIISSIKEMDIKNANLKKGFYKKLDLLLTLKDEWKISWELSDIRYSMKNLSSHIIYDFYKIYRKELFYDEKKFLEYIEKYELNSIEQYQEWMYVFKSLATGNWNLLSQRYKYSWNELHNVIKKLHISWG
jgi:5'-3' exonuclease